MDVSFISLGQSAWGRILNCVTDALVFIDSKSAECLHWCVGFDKLLSQGALAIKELDAYKYFQNPLENATKAVFISGSSYASIQADLCDIISQSSFEKVILVIMPLPVMSLATKKLRDDLQLWMSIKNGNLEGLHAEIQFFPLFIAPILDTVIMIPPFREIFPPLDINKVKAFGSRHENLSIKDQMAAESLAVYLDCLLSQIAAADVVFSVGTLSSSVASALEDLPSVHQRRKMARHQISVLIVDRTLDLCTPTSFDSKCFLDKLLIALPHLPEHSNDVAVNMSQLAQVTVDSASDEALFPGCLSHHDTMCKNIMEWMIHKKDRDILINLHQMLRAKLSQSHKFSTRVKPEALEKDVRQFRGNIEKIHENSGVLQIALAVVQALMGENVEDIAVVLSTERIMRQNISVSPDTSELAGILPQISKLLAERHIRNLSLDVLLTLIVLLYSLIGSDLTFPLREEVQLQAALSIALFEDQEYPGLVHDILLPLQSSKEKVDSIAAHIFAILKALSHTRRDLTRYRSLLREHGPSMSSEFTPLLQRLMRDILDPSKPIIPDLSCKSAGLRELLKSGFSLLLNKQQTSATQHPADQPNLLVLVLGGLTGGEIRLMQEVWNSSVQCKAGGTLLIAGTRLLSPTDTLQAVLKSAPVPL